MKLKALILTSAFLMTVSAQAMESEEDNGQAMEKLRGYNGRMKEDYARKKHHKNRVDPMSVNLKMQLIHDGFMQPSTSQETTDLLTLIGMESEEDNRQAMEKLRGYNGRMKEDYARKKQHHKNRVDPMSVNHDGFMQPSTSQQTTDLLTPIGYVVCCWPCIIISEKCCPNQSN